MGHRRLRAVNAVTPSVVKITCPVICDLIPKLNPFRAASVGSHSVEGERESKVAPIAIDGY
jgi:hypothetical protein